MSLRFEIFEEHIQSIRKVDKWLSKVREATGLDLCDTILAEEYFKSNNNLIKSWYCDEAQDAFWAYIYEPEILPAGLDSTEALYKYMDDCNKSDK